MKALYLLIIISINPLLVQFGFTQAPNAFSYQGVAFDNSGLGVNSRQIALRFSIHKGSAAGVQVYQEVHNVVTDAFGHFITNIGQGNAIIGAFEGIQWSDSPYFLKVEIDINGGSSFTQVGISQMLSVPYALYARSSGNGGSILSDPAGNTKVGTNSLFSLTTGNNNTAMGLNSLSQLTTAYANTALGVNALRNVTTGPNNVALGSGALESNIDGSRNVAVGVGTLSSNTTGYVNNAFGYLAMLKNTTGIENNVFGHQAMEQNITGSGNAVFGHNALQDGVTGNFNTAIGYTALKTNTSDYNVGIGSGAGTNNGSGSNNTFIGYNSSLLNSGLQNITSIGSNSMVSSSNTMVFGNTSVNKWVFGLTTTSNPAYALQVGSNSSNGNGAFLTNGGTWTNASSRLFKEDFQEVDGQKLLLDIQKIEIPKWRYKETNEWHVGPVAEEFKDIFKLGVADDNQHISTIDVSGIALKAIQELINENNQLRRQISGILKEIEALKDKRTTRKKSNTPSSSPQ